MSKEKYVTVDIELDEINIKLLDQLAEKENKTRDEIVNDILKIMIKELDK